MAQFLIWLNKNTKEKFIAKARGYIVFLLEIFLNHISLNANIVRGMAWFDPNILLCIPSEQATLWFAALYQSFSLRGWLESSPEDDCSDECLEFAGHFRQTYTSSKHSPDEFLDMVDLLSGMSELRNWPHLFRLFRLN